MRKVEPDFVVPFDRRVPLRGRFRWWKVRGVAVRVYNNADGSGLGLYEPPHIVVPLSRAREPQDFWTDHELRQEFDLPIRYLPHIRNEVHGLPLYGQEEAAQQGPAPGSDGVLATVVIGEPTRRKKGQKYDCLSRIAEDFYDDALLWPVLYEHTGNRILIGPNPNLTKAGQQIVVPAIQGLTAEARAEVRQRGRNWQQYNR